MSDAAQIEELATARAAGVLAGGAPSERRPAGTVAALTAAARAATRRDLLLLAGVTVSALAIRLAYVRLRTVISEWDGATYLALAANLARGAGFRTDPDGALHTWFQPGYPALVALLHRCGLGLEAAGYAVAAVAGALALIPLFLIARTLYSRRVAVICVILAATSYRLIETSAAVLSEMPFVALWLWGVLAAVSAVKDDRSWLRHHLLGGAALGLASMVRTEAAMYFGLFVLLALLRAAWRAHRRGPWRPALLGAGAAVLAFGAFVLPYGLYLHSELGYFTLTGRSAKTVFAVFEAPTETYQVYFMSPLQYVLHHPGDTLARIVRNCEYILRRHFTWAFHPAHIFLVAASFLATRWSAQRARMEVVVGLVFVFPWVTFFGITGVLPRYYVASIALATVWVANGVDGIYTAARQHLVELGRRRPPRRWLVELVTVGVVLLAFARPALVPLARGTFPVQAQQQKDQQLGAYLKASLGARFSAGMRILCASPRIPYYAGGVHYGAPNHLVTAANLEAFLASTRIDVLVIDDFFADQPGLERLLDPQRAPAYLTLAKSFTYTGDDGHPAVAQIYTYAARRGGDT
jgi:4-amino-4-deoxy-L-arabinose transferase-like glycosyltransferase